MGRYLTRKLIIYIITFLFAVTLNWAVPRFAPGDPIKMLLSRFEVMEGGKDILESFFVKTFGLDRSPLQQYVGFWRSLFAGDLGVSISQYPKSVFNIIRGAIIYDFIILLPAIILSWIIGNKLGAFSGVNKKADNFLMPVFYFLTSSPYFWFALVISYVFGIVLGLFPTSHAYSSTMRPGWTLAFIWDFFLHWFMPFLSLFLVQLGGWAIGMRNMIIYETNTNYASMESLGATERLIRNYGFRNGILPQVTGLPSVWVRSSLSGAYTDGVFVPGPRLPNGSGHQQNDYFLIQGCFLFLIIMVACKLRY